MVDRKPLFGPTPSHPELEKLLKQALTEELSDAQLEVQRVSFAYGNAPESSQITKESVRNASRRLRISG